MPEYGGGCLCSADSCLVICIIGIAAISGIGYGAFKLITFIIS